MDANIINNVNESEKQTEIGTYQDISLLMDEMDENLLIEVFNNILKLSSKPAESMEFKCVKWSHLKSKKGFQLDCDRVEEEGSRMTRTFIPDLEPVSPSYELIGFLDEFKETHINDCEASARVVIDAIIKEAMKLTGNSPNRKICLENNVSWYSEFEKKVLKHEDFIDYTIGSDKEPTCCLLAIEAKREIKKMKTHFENYEEAIRQSIGYAASLAKLRRKAFTLFENSKEETPVFGAISTGFSWYFFAIDDDVVYSGGPEIYINHDKNRKFYNSEGLRTVLQWLVWILKTMRNISPRSPLEDLTIDLKRENLMKIRKCFK